MPRLSAPLPVFVYGTLRPEAARGPVAARLARQGKRLGPARLRGRLYRIDWYMGAIADPRGEAWVHGELIGLPLRGDLLARLDRYEGYYPGMPRRGLFRREVHAVETGQGPVAAWVYVYIRAVGPSQLVPSGDILNDWGV